jgi:citrate lyase subunit beta/citryl-CoA lyase
MLGVEAVRLPKAEDPAAVSEAAAHLDDAGSRAVVHPTIESARGLALLDELLATSGRVSRVVFGERDFLADIGVDEPGPITDHARAVIAVVSRSHGIGAPIDGAFIDLDDTDGLRRSCETARSFGFGGKSALHPKQLDIINTAFSPSRDQVKQARATIGAFEEAQRRGDVTVMVDGRFVDAAVVRRARAVLEMGEGT